MQTRSAELNGCMHIRFAVVFHHMAFGEMMEKVQDLHKTRTSTFRQTKSTDYEQLNQDLEAAPWHVEEIFCNMDDQYD